MKTNGKVHKAMPVQCKVAQTKHSSEHIMRHGRFNLLILERGNVSNPIRHFILLN